MSIRLTPQRHRDWLRNLPSHHEPTAVCPVPDCGHVLAYARTQCTASRPHAVPRPEIQLYASRTGTRRNIQALSDNGWRMLTCPDHLGRYPSAEPPLPYALDNGAWSAHTQDRPFDGDAFMRMVDRLHLAADWLVVPDIVAGGLESLEFSLSWMRRLAGVACPLLIAVQDGMEPAHVRELLNDKIGIFVGGSTGWKLDTIPLWGAFAAREDCRIHVGRVNSARRIQLCRQHGIHSCDGTAATLFSVNATRLAGAVDDNIPGPLFRGVA